MITKEEAKDKLKRLISDFPKHTYHNEENLKFNYIEPLLMEILGWDRENIIKEQRVLKGRADYILKIGNEEVLVIETKRPNVSLNEEEGRQAVSYAYHRKIKFAVLTNFKEIKVYHALSNIKNIDKNLLKFETGGLFRIPIDQFLTNFDKLFLLSRESFEKGEINKLLSKKDEKLAKPIDKSILDDLLEIREWLSKDLKKLRLHLTKEQIDEIVQILIDRFIFMRSVEDRGLEERDFLLKMVKDFQEGRTNKRLWESLKIKFKIFDKEYNSNLFSEGLLEKEGFFDEQILSKVIKELYFGNEGQQERYMFDEIPGDLLGSIYEQYLGTVLQGTEKRVKLESESGKRKKMGIYYTPSYIVDYIVKNTVGEYIKDKTIDEILEVRILDPACGSGSFLTKAFQEVAKAIEERLKKGEKAKNYQAFQSYNGRLTLGQKATILLNCIHGVDLDEKAVELAQLILLLKLLEDETPETKRRLLPNMKDNIKNGNSLIDDPKIAGNKAFNWHAQFPDVFRQGGFDVVIGNPPYGAKLTNEEKKYLDKNIIKDKSQDTANYFITKNIKLLKINGKLGFIVPKGLSYVPSSQNVREEVIKNKINFLIDVSEAFGKDVQYEQLIIIISKEDRDYNNFINGFFANGKFNENQSPKEILSKERLLMWINNHNFNIIKKIINNSIKLDEIAKSRRGLGCNKYVSTEKNDFICLKGQNVQRYRLDRRNYISKNKINQEYKWLLTDKIIAQEIVGRYGKPLFGNFRNVQLKATLDLDNSLTLDTVVNIFNIEGYDIKFVLALLNSRLMSWFFHIYFYNKAQITVHFGNEYVRNFPIPKKIDKKQEQKVTSLVDEMLKLQKQLHEGNPTGNEKERLEQQIKNIDYEIDQEVYKLYGLTKEEIKIVEESLK
ncbi:N-6 DNA methylase [Candidatus Pacearchaeota archaeon]|nr:N-6 DNA methylase [Candidatus Pacearchaeota archaeon]